MHVKYAQLSEEESEIQSCVEQIEKSKQEVY